MTGVQTCALPIFVVEGGGGSGKSTLVDLVKEVYPAEKVLVTREIGGSPFAEEIRKILLSPVTKDVSVDALVPFVTASRIDHVRQVIAPALQRGTDVVCDRFDSSTYAYQIFGNEGYHLKEWFWKLRDLFKEALPDLYVFLDIDPAKSIARAGKRNISGAKAVNYFDQKEIEYHKRVYAGYREFLQSVPHKIVNADQPLRRVKSDFLSVMKGVLG